VVTGASAGIGREFAGLLAAGGHDLVLVSRNHPALESLKRDLEAAYGIFALVVPMDLSLSGAAARVHGACLARGIRVDILVNNAGAGHYGETAAMPEGKIERLLMLNAVALTELCALFGADMKYRGNGRILNISSAAAYLTVPYAAVYSASKSYVTSFSESFRAEMKPYGVTVTCLHPGQTRTGFFEAAGGRAVNPRLTMTAREVAEIGLAALFAGKGSVTAGFLNRIGIRLGRHIPPGLAGAYMRRSIRDRQNRSRG
jgi:short-subunit dehydrogenase